MSRETETACWAAQDCRLDPNCADYGYQCAATAAREVEIRADERAKTAEQIAAAIEAYPGARGPAIDDPRDPRRAGLDTARRIARNLGKAAT